MVGVSFRRTLWLGITTRRVLLPVIMTRFRAKLTYHQLPVLMFQLARRATEANRQGLFETGSCQFQRFHKRNGLVVSFHVTY